MKDEIKNPFANLTGDGCSWGFDCMYTDYALALSEALKQGEPFDTLWFGCKKEILSGRVSFDGTTIHCDASVSDDFDTEGLGRVSVPYAYRGDETPPHDWDYNFGAIIDALNEALGDASQNQKDNQEYRGFSVHEIMADNSTGSWIETYILATGPYGTEFPPPGDCYHEWGWQNDEDYEISDEIRTELEAWAIDLHSRIASGSLVPALAKDVDVFRIKPWTDD